MLILRSIRFNNNYVALLIINSYDIKNQIEAMFAKPATAFIRYEHFKNIIENDNYEKDNFKNMCNTNVDNEEPTDNLHFLTSLKDNEISQMNFFCHTAISQIIYISSHCMSDQLQGERRKLTARYKALMTSSRRLTQQQ